MTEENYKEIQENLLDRAEQFKQKASEVEEQVSVNLNEFMGTTAEKLDKAAEKLHTTAEFFRSNNVNKIKEDTSCMVRKNPGKSLIGAIFLGFLIGKIIFK